MADREAAIRAFLARAGWGDAGASALAGDASNRRYLRLCDPGSGRGAVLMDAPPEQGEDVRPFIRIATHLAGLGLSAPRILAADATAGLLLLEDLGDDLFARVLKRRPDLETALYATATDLLVALHRHPPPDDLPDYDPPRMVALSALAFDWYLAAGTDRPDPTPRAAFCRAFAPILADHTACDVLVQRDYHAENLLWLPDRTGVARVGLLDFQDAMAGHRAYDLVSLLQDARRDVHRATEETMIARYIAATGQDDTAFRAACSILGAQRNLRIIGVFARLCLRDGKAHYVDLIPRVWRLLRRDLDHSALAPVADIVLHSLPAPTPDILAELRKRCATVPAL